jgi:hypothetical protein
MEIPHGQPRTTTVHLQLKTHCLYGKLVLVIARTVILGCGSRWTHDHILLFHYSGSSEISVSVQFSKSLLAFTSTVVLSFRLQDRLYKFGADRTENTASSIVTSVSAAAEKCRCNGRLYLLHYFGFRLSCHNTLSHLVSSIIILLPSPLREDFGDTCCHHLQDLIV